MLNHASTDGVQDSDRTGSNGRAVDGDGQDPSEPDGDAREDTPQSRAESTEGGQRSISKDDAFHLLQNARRRAVLRYLLEHSDPATFEMRDIAEVVAAWEHDTTRHRLTSDERQRVYIALYQSHLPKLDEHGLIRYNQPRGVVEPTPLLAVFEPFLEEGLYADTQELSVDGLCEDDGGDTDSRPQVGSARQAALDHVLSSLFSR